MHKIIPIHKVQTYLTEEEAEKHLVDFRMLTIFCPLIKDRCRIDCICYEKSFVYDMKVNGIKRYAVQEGYCSNVMFIGMEAIE